MARGIPITSGRGVQGVALVFAAALLASAYFYTTTGRGTPFPGCWPPLPEAHALVLAAAYCLMAVGFLGAAFRHPAGPSLKDPLLIVVLLAMAAVRALDGGAYTIATGVARLGQSGCLVVGPPWSDAIGVLSLSVGALALYFAATVAMNRRSSD